MALTTKLKNQSLSEDERKKLAADFQAQFDPERKIQVLGDKVVGLLNEKSPKAVGIGYLYGALNSIKNPGSISPHASVIIGKRISTDSGKCEFLVRDSFGSSCNDEDGRPRYSLPCENGGVWVHARSLMKSTMSLSWIP
jgi:hypothetical protein